MHSRLNDDTLLTKKNDSGGKDGLGFHSPYELLVDGDIPIFLGCIHPFYNLNCIGGGAGLEGRYWKMAVYHET